MLHYHSNLILVAGTGRNSGKTTLVCKLIKLFSKNKEVVAVKISSHNHHDEYDTTCATAGNGYRIWRETNPPEGKDTYRMLHAGAHKVYYVECNQESLEEAFYKIKSLTQDSALIICESGGLRHLVQPGLFIMATNDREPKESAKLLLPLADLTFSFTEIISFEPQSIIQLIAKLPDICTPDVLH
jgi:Molybdopterin-guanine dinucleotide biosynthesis protein